MADLTTEQVNDFIEATALYGEAMKSYSNWLTGSASGGPDSDGYYPAYDPESGTYINIPCRARERLDMSVLSEPVYDATIPIFPTKAIVTLGNDLKPWRATRAFTLVDVKAAVCTPGLGTAPAATMVIDVNVNSSSILSTKINILPGQMSSRASGTTQPIISGGSIEVDDDALFTFDIDAAGEGALGLEVTLIGFTS